jgi:hypothetical protein
VRRGEEHEALRRGKEHEALRKGEEHEALNVGTVLLGQPSRLTLTPYGKTLLENQGFSHLVEPTQNS